MAMMQKDNKVVVTKTVKEKLLAMDKKERRAFLRELRARSKPETRVALEAKRLWEKLRSGSTPADVKKTVSEKLLALLRGSLSKLVFAHDTSRIVQSLFANGDKEIRDAIFDELTPELIKMMKSQYAKYFVAKILKNGQKHQRDLIISSLKGHCVELFNGKVSAVTLELIYNDYASPSQRAEILCEFYGKEFVFFKNESEAYTLSGIAETLPHKIAPIIKNLEEVLHKAVEKDNIKHTMTHKLLYDYFQYCSRSQKLEMVAAIKERLPEIVHNREGADVAMQCIWNCDSADRKIIVKNFKGLAVKSANDQYARRVLFAIFDSVDDTTLINKFITKEIADNIADVIFEKYGVTVLHYIVHPRDVRVLGKNLIESLERGDGNEFSKKPMQRRYEEIYNAMTEPLYLFLAANMRDIIFNKTSSVLVLDALEPNKPEELMKRSIDPSYKKKCFDAIAEICSDELLPESMDTDTPHIIRSGAARFVLRKLLKADKLQTDVKLSDSMAELSSEQLASFMSLNAGCFDLFNMASSGSDVARSAVIKVVNLKNLLKKTSFLGARLLYEELSGKKWPS